MKIFISLIFISISLISNAQQQGKGNKYGLVVMSTKKEYHEKITLDKDHMMIELKSVVPSIVYELRYADTSNFMHRRMYPSNTDRTFLRALPAKALISVAEELKQIGLGIKVWDAYRPYSVTEDFWELVKDERYAANPAKGSGHNRGLAIDLTLYNLSDQKELDMGTAFDDFSEKAHADNTNHSEEILRNRKNLKDAMLNAGFKQLPTEWWHFYWPNDRGYDLLDIPFKKL
ncbi:MAG: M15 family metallopeptidase [Flavitalea sp.]